MKTTSSKKKSAVEIVEIEKEHKVSEINLKLLQNIFQNAPAAIAVFDGPEQKFILANTAYEKIINRKAEDLIGKSLREVLPELKGTGTFELYDNILKTGEPYIVSEYPALADAKNDGVLRQMYLNISMEPLKNDEGKVYAVLTMTIDITEQVEARKKTEESEAFSRSVLESSPDCVKVIDVEGQLQFMNVNGLCTMEIDDFSVFKNKPWSELWGVDNKHLINGAIDKALAGNTASFQAFCPTAKGTPKYWNVMVSPVVSPGSNKINSLISVSRDVTEQMLAQKKIEESETLHRQIFEFSPVAIWEKDDTALYQEIELLKQKGIKDFRKYLDTNPAEIFRLVSLVKLEDVNNESVDLLQAASKQEVITSFHKLFTEESIPMLKEGIIGVAENKKRLTIATVLQSLKGKRLEILISFDFRIGNDLNKSLVSLTDITEQVDTRKKIEANEIQLRKTSEYLQIATNAAEVGIWSLDLASQKLDWSPLHKRMWGYDDQRSDLAYEDWHKVILTEDKKAAFAEVAKALKTKKNYEAVYRIKRDNDGEVRWMKSSGQYFYNEKDEPVMLTGVSFDITNEKIAEENLLASEERIRMATKASGVGIWEWNVITNKIRWDAQMFLIYGVAPTADGFVAYSTWSNAVAPEDLSVQEKILQDTVKIVGTSNRNFKIYRANDGMLSFIEAIETVRTNAAGQAEWVVGTNLDVTEKVLARKKVEDSEKQYRDLSLSLEEKVKERTTELKSSEEKFYTLFNLSPVCKTLADATTGKIVMVNDAFTNVFGYSREEALNKNSAELGMIDPEVRETTTNELKAYGKILNKEMEFLKKSGESFFALASAEAIMIGDKQFLLAAYNDISDRKKAELDIEQKNSDLEKMNKELESFAYISSHDLQEPLRKIQTFATRITEKEENNLSDNGKYMFSRMQEAARRMQTLIQDLLTYSRTNTEESKFENTDLNKIVEEVRDDLKEELKNKHATIEATELCEAHIIPFQFRQLLHNLIGNSLKFSNPNNPPHIQIKSDIIKGFKLKNEKLSPENKYCHITVSDNGIGFEQQYSEKIFEVFQRLHGKNEYNGTGIGLAIVKKIVENHNGIITANGELNKGATFEIYIPVI